MKRPTDMAAAGVSGGPGSTPLGMGGPAEMEGGAGVRWAQAQEARLLLVVAGAIAPYALVAALFALGTIIEPLFLAVVAFVLYVPVTYLLVLIMHVVLGSLHLSSYTGVGDFLLPNWDGLLWGAGIAALIVMKVSHGDDDRYLAALFMVFPLPFFVAGLTDIPLTLPGWIAVGVAWGVVAAASALALTSLLDQEPVKDAWLGVAVAEVLCLFLLLAGTIAALTDKGIKPFLSLILGFTLAAAAACGGTYLLACLGATIGGWAKWKLRKAQRRASAARHALAEHEHATSLAAGAPVPAASALPSPDQYDDHL